MKQPSCICTTSRFMALGSVEPGADGRQKAGRQTDMALDSFGCTFVSQLEESLEPRAQRFLFLPPASGFFSDADESQREL